MDNQERYKYQQAHPLFRDGREQRPIVPGTIARQDEKLMETDPHFFEGRIGDEWAETLPARVELSEALLRRGQARFAIYCAPCHGLDGYGEGAVHQRVMQNLMFSSKWVQPLSLHDEQPRSRPVGHIFNSITNGIRTMPPYGDQIAEPDRWAIVAYVRALQRSQSARPDDLNPQERSELEARE
jgi:mono/diheme cytochrome c family protein